MSTEQVMRSARAHRWLGSILGAACAVGIFVVPDIATAGGGEAEMTGEEDVAEGRDVQRKFIEAYNAKKWDAVAELYAEDAIAIPPNHEPVKGRAAIVDYWKSVRDTVGEAACGEPMDSVASGKYVASVGRNCTAYSGSLGFTFHELVERGEDGTWRYKFDMFGLR